MVELHEPVCVAQERQFWRTGNRCAHEHRIRNVLPIREKVNAAEVGEHQYRVHDSAKVQRRNTSSGSPTSINYGPEGIEFKTGLTVVSSAATWDITVIYE